MAEFFCGVLAGWDQAFQLVLGLVSLSENWSCRLIAIGYFGFYQEAAVGGKVRRGPMENFEVLVSSKWFFCHWLL